MTGSRVGVRTVSGARPAVQDAVRRPGQPLDGPTRASMETRLMAALDRAAPSPLSRPARHGPLSGARNGSDSERQAEALAQEASHRDETGESAEVRARPADRARFDFARIRIHADARAAESARALGALAYTVGHDIVFAAGQYAPSTPAGRLLIAHELTHAMQQGTHGVATVQAKGPGSDEVDLRGTLEDLDARVTTAGATLTYGRDHKVVVKVGPDVKSKSPFAYEFLPPLTARDYAIIRLVVGPGVAVSLDGFPKSWIPDLINPSVEIYRVQDYASIPAQGTPIQPSRYVGMAPATEPSEEALPLLQAPPTFAEIRRPDGVDIAHLPSGRRLEIRVPHLSGAARFAYQLLPGAPLASGNDPQRLSTIVVVKTPDVSVVSVGPPGPFVDPRLNLYEVPGIAQVPAQGTAIDETALASHALTTWKSRTEYSVQDTLAMAAIDVSIGAIPIVGDLVDIAEYVYGIFTGYDRWGRALTDSDLAVMGMAAILPFGNRGVVKGAEGLAKATGRSADDVLELLRGATHLDAAEQGQINRWRALLESGKGIPKDEIADVKRVFTKAEEGARLGAKTGKAAGQVTFRLRIDTIYRDREGRNMAIVDTSAGPRAFYARSGTGSGLQSGTGKDDWVPFHGVLLAAQWGPLLDALKHFDLSIDELAALPPATRAMYGRNIRDYLQLGTDAEWIIKPAGGGRLGPADVAPLNAEISTWLKTELAGQSGAVKDATFLNGWLRDNGVDVGRGFQAGDPIPELGLQWVVVDVP